MKHVNMKIAVNVFLVILLFCQSVSAKDFSRPAGLENISSVKAYFDVKVGVPSKLATQLQVIDDAYRQLVKLGVKTKFVIGFRGEASYFVTRGDDYIFEEDAEAKKKIYTFIKSFKSQGIVLEQCSVSAGLYEIKQQDFLKEIEVVQNSYASIVAYQSAGYAFVPIY